MCDKLVFMELEEHDEEICNDRKIKDIHYKIHSNMKW